MSLIQDLNELVDSPEGTQLILKVVRLVRAAGNTLASETAADYAAQHEAMVQDRYRREHARFVDGDLVMTGLSSTERAEAERLRQIEENRQLAEKGLIAVAQDGRAAEANRRTLDELRNLVVSEDNEPEPAVFDPNAFTEEGKLTDEAELAMDRQLARLGL